MPTPIPEDEGNLGENMSGLHMAGPIRRCKSEDAGYKHRTSTPRVTIKPSYPVSNDDIKTPLLMVNEEDDDFESNNHPLSRGSDETDDGTKSPTRSKTLSRRRRYGLRIVKYVVFALVIIGMIVSLVHTLIFCTRKHLKLPEVPECEIFEANLNEEAIENDKDQYEYSLPWLYSGLINSSLTHIKCDNREFVALQKGKYTIHVKIHIDTYQHRTLDHNKQYPLRLCMMSDDKVLHCSVKRQASKEVDTMELNQIIDMEDGQKFSFLLRTDEKPRNVIKKYHNRVQIHKNDCHPLKSSNK